MSTLRQGLNYEFSIDSMGNVQSVGAQSPEDFEPNTIIVSHLSVAAPTVKVTFNFSVTNATDQKLKVKYGLNQTLPEEESKDLNLRIENA